MVGSFVRLGTLCGGCLKGKPKRHHHTIWGPLDFYTNPYDIKI